MIESETPAEPAPAEAPVPNSTPPVETPVVPPSSDNSANVDKMLQVFQQLASQQGTQSKLYCARSFANNLFRRWYPAADSSATGDATTTASASCSCCTGTSKAAARSV